MEITYAFAVPEDAPLLVQLYDAAFYDDYVRYGACPGYGRTAEQMRASIERIPKQIIFCDGAPVGVLSVENRGKGRYYLGALLVKPDFQGRGIGRAAVTHLLDFYADWREITLVTPVDKAQNVRFYTQQ